MYYQTILGNLFHYIRTTFHCIALYGLTVYILGRDEGYMVKYTPLPEGVPDGNPNRLYLIVYPKLSPNTVTKESL